MIKSIHLKTHVHSFSVRFRALCLTPDLRPVKGKIEYQVQDPNDNIVFLEPNAQLVNGVAGGNLQLTKDAVDGDWKITFTYQVRRSYAIHLNMLLFNNVDHIAQYTAAYCSILNLFSYKTSRLRALQIPTSKRKFISSVRL